jgi:hypothetical protein
VDREEIYSGTFILDGLRITPEQQRQQIIDEMRKNGIEVSDDDELEIGYEGVEDDYGISDTQETKYTVFKVTRTRFVSNVY